MNYVFHVLFSCLFFRFSALSGTPRLRAKKRKNDGTRKKHIGSHRFQKYADRDGSPGSLTTAKEARKRAELDAQLLANRIALLKQEEEKVRPTMWLCYYVCSNLSLN